MAARALGNIKEEEAVTPLIYALPIGGPLTTASSIALKKILGDKAIDLFIKILKGEVNGAKDIVARWNAAETLGSLKNTRAVQPLIDVLHDENEHLRERVAFSLGIIGDERAVEPLIEALKDNSKAARALGMINSRRAVEPLIEALKDENKKKRVVNRVCQDIIWALGRSGDKRAFAPLQKCLDNEDFYVQLETKKALQKIAKKIT
jgi:HEAT repeat protein